METPREWLRRKAKEFEREANNLAINLANNRGRERVCFCANGGTDWSPLHTLTHLCDVFIYADPNTTKEMANNSLSTIHERTGVGNGLRGVGLHYGRLPEAFKRLSSSRASLPAPAEDGSPGVKPWVGFFQLERIVAGRARPLRLLYFGGGAPAAIYRHFFKNRGPTVLYVMVDPLRLEERPDSWDGPMGRAVAASAKAEPRFLVFNSRHDWPWTQHWQTLSSGTATRIYVRPSRDPGKGCVVVATKGLTPDALGDADAVFVDADLLRAYQWPKRIALFVSAPNGFRADERTRRMNPKFTAVDVAALPLADALKKIEEVCKRRRIQRLASIKLGCEDEGPGLALWGSTGGRVPKLTIHCPLPGDVMSFGPFADAIE